MLQLPQNEANLHHHRKKSPEMIKQLYPALCFRRSSDQFARVRNQLEN